MPQTNKTPIFRSFRCRPCPTPQAYNKATQNSTVVGFYPADDPEIAFSVVIENGEYSKYLVRKIIEAYYGYESGVEEISPGLYKSVVK